MKVLIVDGCKERRRDLTVAISELTNVIVQGAVPDVRSALDALATVALGSQGAFSCKIWFLLLFDMFTSSAHLDR
jgi:hypothetical protein